LSEKGVQNSGEVVGQGFEKISNARPSGRETQAALKSGAADLGLPSEARKKQAPRSALYDSFEDSNERAATRKVPQPPSPIPPPKDAR
jgi:hypothetical protein